MFFHLRLSTKTPAALSNRRGRKQILFQRSLRSPGFAQGFAGQAAVRSFYTSTIRLAMSSVTELFTEAR